MVCDIDMEFFHQGIPQWQLNAVLTQPEYPNRIFSAERFRSIVERYPRLLERLQ